MESDLGKKSRGEEFGQKSVSLKRLKGNGQKVERCDLLSFPPSFGSAASDTFLRTEFELQLKLNYGHVPSTGRGALSEMSAYDALFTDPAIPKIHLVKAAGPRCWTRGEMLDSFFFFLLFHLHHFSFITDSVVYICNHIRELWARLMAASNVASLTRKFTLPAEGMFFLGRQKLALCVCASLCPVIQLLQTLARYQR